MAIQKINPQEVKSQFQNRSVNENLKQHAEKTVFKERNQNTLEKISDEQKGARIDRKA